LSNIIYFLPNKCHTFFGVHLDGVILASRGGSRFPPVLRNNYVYRYLRVFRDSTSIPRGANLTITESRNWNIEVNVRIVAQVNPGLLKASAYGFPCKAREFSPRTPTQTHRTNRRPMATAGMSLPCMMTELDPELCGFPHVQWLETMMTQSRDIEERN